MNLIKHVVFLLAGFLFLFRSVEVSVYAYDYAFTNMEIQDSPFRDCGILYTEIRNGMTTHVSFSENGKLIAVAKGSHINVYEEETSQFLFGFYSATDKSSLSVSVHDDWIEIYNSNGKYYAYQFDGTLLCSARVTSDSVQVHEFGYDSISLSENEHEINSYIFTDNITFPKIVFHEQTTETEKHICFDLKPVSVSVPALQKTSDFHDEYAPLRYSVNAGGETLIHTGDYLHIYYADGYYQQSFFLEGLSRKSPVIAFYHDCIQIYTEQDHLLVTYDRTDGSVLSAGIISDTEQNQIALNKFHEKCFSRDTETEDAVYWFTRDQVTRIQGNRYYLLYQKQYYTEQENYGMIHGLVLLSLGGIILINQIRLKKEEAQLAEK